MDIKELDQQAFPTSAGGHTLFGMSMRDYFAAKAMQALITNADQRSAFEADLWVGGRAYEIADAMLEARKS